MRRVRFTIAAAALSISLSACGDDITTPSSTASGTPTEYFSGTIWPGGETSYAFTVNQDGLITETLGSVTAAGAGRAAEDATLTIGFGVPHGTGCGRSQSVDTKAGLMPQLGTTAPAGIYCADVSAPANAPGPFDFVLRIVHP
ncbi:MAG TPA: hypothetical protein VH417_14605 [Vicinamibacterales bacterium]|jgi:hypothetical protein